MFRRDSRVNGTKPTVPSDDWLQAVFGSADMNTLLASASPGLLLSD
jgi:hypothetical protein